MLLRDTAEIFDHHAIDADVVAEQARSGAGEHEDVTAERIELLPRVAQRARQLRGVAVQGALQAAHGSDERLRIQLQRIGKHQQQTQLPILHAQFAGRTGERIGGLRPARFVCPEGRDAQITMTGMAGIHGKIRPRTACGMHFE